VSPLLTQLFFPCSVTHKKKKKKKPLSHRLG
jgi:hypothetical protein